MPEKTMKNNKKFNNTPNQPQKSGLICSFQGPGPIYKLKPVVGYQDHCHSKYRNPAFSIPGKRINREMVADGPGPKYRPEFPKSQGRFILLMMPSSQGLDCTPGPYNIPTPTPRPAFSMKWRTKMRGEEASPGPYDIPRDLNGPAFTMGQRHAISRYDNGPSPGQIKLDMVKPRAPAFSLCSRPPDPAKSASPGPYNPVMLKKSPAFSFGIKHSPCAPPLITECDQLF